ncbi:MAG TPA: twin-arginine translocation signal domain-containing protein, partial [Isosphaeraceae bacterium]|nr:twin-arginine translocation signal domain-containing protein [Isosphaeraceae bacterium]
LSMRKGFPMRVPPENTVQPDLSNCGVCAGKSAFLSRRQFLGASALAIVAGQMKPGSRTTAGSEQRVIVGAYPWVYAATQPRYDIYPTSTRSSRTWPTPGSMASS